MGINANLFRAWVYRNIKTDLITGLNGLQLLPPVHDVYSIHNKAVPAKIRTNIVSAFCKVANIVLHRDSGEYGALGQFSSSGQQIYVVEITEGGIRQAAVIKNSKIYACKKVNDSIESYIFKDGYDNGVLLLSAIIYYETCIRKDVEFENTFTSAFKLFKAGLNQSNMDEFCECMAVLSENLYRRLCSTPSKIAVEPLNDGGNVVKLTSHSINSYNLAEADSSYGRFKVMSCASTYSAPQPEENKTVNETVEREWTEEEKRLIPQIDPWYIVPKEVPEICNLILKSTNTYKPKRNFMFRGPSSTGKTSMARAIAATLGMPYVYLTCSADTESSAFLGEPMYDTDGKVKYVESNFIKAIKNGWFVEIQEPYVIAKQGVLTALNGLLDDSAGITLATGEFVKRHPDCVVCFTTNVSYVGCKKPNQSVLRRMNNVYDVELPSKQEIINRVISNTKLADKPLLSKMVDCMKKINEYLEDEMIEDGVCGVSEVIDWASTIQITKDILASAESTIISKATDSVAEQAKIAAIIESCIKESEYNDGPQANQFAY